MIWLIFKNCGKKNKNKPVKSDDTNQGNNSKQIAQELVRELDVFDDLDKCDDDVFLTDKHFDYLSVFDPYHDVTDAVPNTIKADHGLTENNVVLEINELKDNIESVTLMINNRCNKVTEKHLETLQCPFTWGLEPEVWETNIVHRTEHLYGKYNTNLSSIGFSFEKYISNLIISCGLFNAGQVDKAHDKLKNIWKWLDKLDNQKETFYLSIRDGLKHIIMSTLCHVLYTVNKVQCRQLFNIITRFIAMDTKSRAAVYAIRAAVCTEIGGKTLQNVVQYAKKACDSDPDVAQWKYFHSVALTTQRQYLMTNKSCPTAAEFDAIQHAIILSREPNPYFNYHRVHLMTNKILYHIHFDNNNANTNEPKKMKQDFSNIVELIKAIIVTVPAEDPHLIVKCAKSLMTLPYVTKDNIHLVKQIISIALNVSADDPTVLEAIKKSIGIFKELIDVYKKISENKTSSVNANPTENEVTNEKDADLENDLKLIAEKHKNGSRPVLDLIKLLEKYDGCYRWKIMAQICSYSILFKDSADLLVGVEQFMMLIHDENIAISEIVRNHRSIFIKENSKEFNLAELVCNEIKLAIMLIDNIKKRDETQFYLDQLTRIMDVCRVKSKNINPSLVNELVGCERKQEERRSVHKQIDKRKRTQTPKQVIVSKNLNKTQRLRPTTNNHRQSYKPTARNIKQRSNKTKIATGNNLS